MKIIYKRAKGQQFYVLTSVTSIIIFTGLDVLVHYDAILKLGYLELMSMILYNVSRGILFALVLCFTMFYFSPELSDILAGKGYKNRNEKTGRDNKQEGESQ